MTSADEWGEELDASAVVNPVVLHFRPNKYLKVDEEHLEEWEQFFLENVGFRPPAESRAPWAGSPGGGVSGSNGGWDDCIN